MNVRIYHYQRERSQNLKTKTYSEKYKILKISYSENNKNLKNPYHPEKDFYTTEYFTDVAMEYVDDALKQGDQPFFLYLAYNVPHFPLELRHRPGW